MPISFTDTPRTANVISPAEKAIIILEMLHDQFFFYPHNGHSIECTCMDCDDGFDKDLIAEAIVALDVYEE